MQQAVAQMVTIEKTLSVVYNMDISEIEKIFKKSVTTQTNRRSSTYSPILCTYSIQ
jgi:hypothetical protein